MGQERGGAGGVVHVVEHLPSKQEALNSNTSPTKKILLRKQMSAKYNSSHKSLLDVKEEILMLKAIIHKEESIVMNIYAAVL
jgi:hypothetical protein